MTPNIGYLKYKMFDYASPTTSKASTVDLEENTPQKPYWAPKKSKYKKKTRLKT